jgi:phosphomannomutase
MKMALPGAVPVSSETGLYEIRDRAQSYLADGIPPGETRGPARPGS